MNIFFTSHDPDACAVVLDNLRLNKMILETAQLLSTAMRFHGYDKDDVYKSTHVNHPCAVWTRATKGNYLWLYEHFNALAHEAHFRKGGDKWHKSYSDLDTVLSLGLSYIPHNDLWITEKPRCISNKGIRDNEDYGTCEAYQRYLCDKWQKDIRPPSWGKRGEPLWCDKVTYAYSETQGHTGKEEGEQGQ